MRFTVINQRSDWANQSGIVEPKDWAADAITVAVTIGYHRLRFYRWNLRLS